ncbi:DUF6134 family protein [Thalassospira marina]|uniref:Uncharacterized protein n=1 Tax=Thalassospira marina TaxID=2048283 RepID=A0A2N3KJ68_9PROT|nr:DUF6134 family protein [Thalassospira marina]PKR50513.1 hypothetical protein COO20_20430 [Thalassospira marina]
MKGQLRNASSSLPKNTVLGTWVQRILFVVVMAAIVLGFCFSAAAQATPPFPGAQCRDIDPIKLYGGNEWDFQIRREGAPVGTHRLSFHPGRDGVQVIAESTITISFLGFTAYQFDYRSESLWQQDQLAKLAVTVDDDGDKTTVTARHDAKTNSLVVTGPDGSETLPATIFPTDHWHCGVLASQQVLNTITGHANRVRITNLGLEKITAGNGGATRIAATHIRYDGELQTDAWYDAEGRWVGLAFKARDGSSIIYRCLTCTKITGNTQ